MVGAVGNMDGFLETPGGSDGYLDGDVDGTGVGGTV